MAKIKFPLIDFRTIVIIILVLLFLVVWFLRQGEEKIQKEEFQLPVSITKAQRGTVQKTFRISAYVESESMVTVLPKIAGTLLEMDVRTGDYVEKGQVIARIDDESYQLQYQQALTAFTAAESTFDRINRLYQVKAATQQDFDQAQAQFNVNKTQLDMASLQLQYTAVQAPVSGVVLVKHATVGSLVASQVPLVTLGNLEDLVIKANIPESYYRFFLQNWRTMPVTLEVPALGGSEAVRIGSMAPYVSPETKTFEVVCELPETGDIRPGMFCYVNFVLEQREKALYLPYSVLTSDEKLWYVDSETGTVHSFVPEESFRGDSSLTISDEYEESWFVADGQHFLTEGLSVKILNPEKRE